MTAGELPRRWAILIGINFYSDGNTRAITYYNLQGCVRDITAVEDYLVRVFSVEESCIMKLTATAPDDIDGNEPKEEPSNRPTYGNMVQAFMSVTNRAREGDLVYIHYSGHGAKVATTYPQHRGLGGSDEALVPTDVCTGGRYLRDLEVASLLSAMVQKKLAVTVTLDSSHSGTGTRGHFGPVARGIGKMDTTVLPSDRLSELTPLVASFFTIAGVARADQTRESWFLQPEGYELFTACRRNQVANEDRYPDENGEWYGAFTYRLLEIFNVLSVGATHGVLSQTIHDRIRNDFGKQQTPVFTGDAGRYFFNIEQHIPTLAVQQVEGSNVSLNVDKAISACNGMEYAIYPQDAVIPDSPNLLARVIVTESSKLELSARLLKDRSPLWSDVKPGCRAIPLQRPYQQLTRIHVPHHNGYQTHQIEALDKILRVNWDRFFSGIAPLVLEHSVNPGISTTLRDTGNGYTVMINEDGKYELWVRNGTVMKLMPNFVPCSIPEIFLDRVTHLAQYRIIKNLKSPDQTLLRGKLSFRVKGKPFL